MTSTQTRTVAVPPRFRLAAAAGFYGGFMPMGGSARARDGQLTLAFRGDHDFEAVAVTLRQQERALHLEVEGTADAARVERQVRRMLGLDADVEAWFELGTRHPRVGALQRKFEGFCTAALPSAYEAAVGGIIAQRTSMQQAAGVRRRLCELHSQQVGGLWVLPSPRQLLAAGASPGLAPQKLERLRAVAAAALEGVLEPDRLRALPVEQALAELEALPGVGGWTAEHILFRGAALPDALPTAEPRVARGLALAFGLSAPPTGAELVRLAEPWRPFRMWVCILAARLLGQSGQWVRVQGDVRGRRSPAAARAPAQ